MKTIIEISSKEEAKEAIVLLSAYIGVDNINVEVETKEAPAELNQHVKKKVPVPKKTVEKDEPVEEDTSDKTEEAVEEKPPKTTSKKWTQKQITDLAKKKVEELGDREEVKKVISNYAAKISEVDESDYTVLAADLEALGE